MNSTGVVSTATGPVRFLEAGRGPAVLLLHGFPLSSAAWGGLVPALARDHRVVAPDLPGTPASPLEADGAPDLTTQARAMRELLDRLAIGRVAIVGHLHGGGLAQLLAFEDPRVAALVLLHPIAFDAWPEPPVRALAAADPAAVDPAAVVAELLRAAAGPTPPTGDLVRVVTASWSGPGGAEALVRAARALDGRGLEAATTAFADRDLPTLILWGEADPFAPTELAERLHDAMPSSSLGVLPGVGRLLMDEAGPTVTTLVVGWLGSRYLGRRHVHPEAPALVELGRRPPWAEDPALVEEDDPPVRYDPTQQEVGPSA